MSKLTVSRLEEFLEEFFEHYIVLKMYHFQTKRYGAHKASDGYLTKLLVSMDQFMEVAQGVVGQVRTKQISVNVSMVTDENVTKELDTFVDIVNDARFKGHPELHAIADTLVTDAQQLKYLLLFR